VQPFVLSSPGRQWIFGGDLSVVEGRAVRPFWALLFTDLIVFAKVSRDRVLFVTEEPLSLLSVTQAFFNIRKKGSWLMTTGCADRLFDWLITTGCADRPLDWSTSSLTDYLPDLATRVPLKTDSHTDTMLAVRPHTVCCYLLELRLSRQVP